MATLDGVRHALFQPKMAGPRGIWYHGASYKNLRSILAQGLIPEVKKKNWDDDPHAGMHAPSREAYGGIYVTTNMMTAISAPRDKAEGRMVLVMMELQPNTFYLDEDDINGRLNAALEHLSDSSFHVPMLYIAATQPDTPAAWKQDLDGFRDRYIDRFVDRMKHLLAEQGTGMNPQLEKRLRSLLPAMWLAALTRLAAHAATQLKDYDVKGAYRKVFPDHDYDEVPSKEELFPTVQQGEQGFREQSEKLTRALRIMAQPKETGYRNTARVTTPIGYRGSNHIVCVLEIRDSAKYRGEDWKKPCPMVVHYGEVPEDFTRQWTERMGSEIEWLDKREAEKTASKMAGDAARFSKGVASRTNTRLEKHYDRFEEWSSSLQFPLTLYRALDVPPDEVDWDALGIHWATDLDNANIHFGDRKKDPTVIEVEVEEDAVDWEETFLNNARYGWHETEVNLRPGASVKIVAVTPEDEITDEVVGTNKQAGKLAAKRGLYFHGTSYKNLRSILSQGLVPEVKEKTWQSDPDANIYTPSREAYGGIYITKNFMTAYNAPRDHYEQGRELVIALELQPNTFLMDEDGVVHTLNAALGRLSDKDLSVGEVYIAVTQDAPGWSNIIEHYRESYIKDCVNYFESTFQKRNQPMHSKLKQRLMEVIGAAWFPSLARLAAHHFKGKEADSEFRKCYTRVFPKALREVKPAASDLLPSIEKAEQDFRKAADQVTRTLKQLTAPNSMFMTGRVMEPIGYTGSNRIVAVVEIRDGKQFRKNSTEPDLLVVHYGKIPAEFLEQYAISVGEYKVVDKNDPEAKTKQAAYTPSPVPKPGTAAEATRIINAVDTDEQVVFYHASTSDNDESIRSNWLEPQIGPWVQEVMNGATDDEEAIEQLKEESTGVVYLSKVPDWVISLVSRKLDNKPHDQITLDDIRQWGQLTIAVVDKDSKDVRKNVGEEESETWHYGDLEDLRGNREPFYDSEKYFGLEPGDHFSTEAVEPAITLVGEELVKFLQQHFPATLKGVKKSPLTKTKLSASLNLQPWIGIDLDGTLAQSIDDYSDPTLIGLPIDAMVEKVRKALENGERFKVFTARMADKENWAKIQKAIGDWTEKYIGVRFEATNEKDPGMVELWDDKARQVIENTGEMVRVAADNVNKDQLSLPDALDEVDGDHDAVKQLLAQRGVSARFGFPGGAIYSNSDYVVELNDDGTVDVTRDPKEFVATTDLNRFVPDADERFNRQFWDDPYDLYHATASENLRSIMKEGLGVRSQTRGLSNRSVGAVLFTTEDPDDLADGSYGDALIRIDMAAMAKETGVQLWVEREPDVVEGQMKEALAARLRIEDFNYDYETGISPNTVMVHGGIPPEFLHIEEGEISEEEEDSTDIKTASSTENNGEMGREPYINAHQSGRTIVIDMMWVPKNQRRKGVGTQFYKDWEQSLPPDIDLVLALASDTGSGNSSAFWESLGFSYRYDGEDLDYETAHWMWKGVNGHPTPETFVIEPERDDDESTGKMARVAATPISEFLHGECHTFTVALIKTTGYAPVLLMSPEEGIVHSAVRLPGTEQLLDASGVTDLAKLRKRYKEPTLVIEDTTEEGITALGYDDDLFDDAMRVAKRVLNKAGIASKQSSQMARVAATPGFEAWFAGSKVVDEDGNPLTVYHGTTGADFEMFNTESEGHLGSHFGDQETAHTFAHDDPDVDPKLGGRIIPVYLSIKNPLRIEDPGSWDLERLLPKLEKAGVKLDPPKGWRSMDRRRNRNWVVNELQQRGYDGIVYANWLEGDGSDSWVVFEPQQIKSAIGNNGAFDPGDERIVASVKKRARKEIPELSTEKYEVSLFRPLGADPDDPASYMIMDRKTGDVPAFADTPEEVKQTIERLMNPPAPKPKKERQLEPNKKPPEARPIQLGDAASVTELPGFKRWFSGSKVVDEQGKPKIVYHGTVNDFEAFSKAFMGQTTGAESAKGGFFFTDHAGTAGDYADVGEGRYVRQLHAEMDRLERIAQRSGRTQDWKKHQTALEEYENAALKESRGGMNIGANVMPVYLSIKNPLERDFGGEKYREETYADLIEEAKQDGHDGVIFYNTHDPGNELNSVPMTVYGVFSSNQIKSAIGNSGEFSSGESITASEDKPEKLQDSSAKGEGEWQGIDIAYLRGDVNQLLWELRYRAECTVSDQYIAISKIRPSQSRHLTKQQGVEEKKKGIADGWFEAVLVETQDGGKTYRLQEGHHRMEAASQLGYKTIPATVVTIDYGDDWKISSVKQVKEEPVPVTKTPAFKAWFAGSKVVIASATTVKQAGEIVKTAGMGGRAVHTIEYANQIAEQLSQAVGSKVEVVGSVKTKGISRNDIDLLVTDWNRDDLIQAMVALGFVHFGQSSVSPEEAKKSGKGFPPGWHEVLHFRDEAANIKVELWHGLPEPKSASAESTSITATQHKKAKEGYDDQGYWVGEGGGASGVLPIARSSKRICLAWRSSDPDVDVHQGDCWGTIGGAMKKGMSPAESAQKEFQEEVGYSGPVDLHPAFVFTDKSFQYHNFVGVVPDEFSFRPGGEHSWETDFIEWFSLDEIDQDMEENPGDYHSGLIQLFKQSRDLIEKLAGGREKTAAKGATVEAYHGTDIPHTGFEEKQASPDFGYTTFNDREGDLAALQFEDQSPLYTALLNLRPQFAAAAQEEYDQWEQDEEGLNDELGTGGICDRVAEAIGSVVVDNIPGVALHDGGWDGDDHAWVIAALNKEAFGIDIPPGVYERGGGYSWTRIPDVTIKPDDVEVFDVPYSEELEDDGFNLEASSHASPSALDWRDTSILSFNMDAFKRGNKQDYGLWEDFAGNRHEQYLKTGLVPIHWLPAEKVVDQARFEKSDPETGLRSVRQIEQAMREGKKFEPALMDEGWLIDGNHRVFAAGLAGLELIPVVFLEDIIDANDGTESVQKEAGLSKPSPYPEDWHDDLVSFTPEFKKKLNDASIEATRNRGRVMKPYDAGTVREAFVSNGLVDHLPEEILNVHIWFASRLNGRPLTGFAAAVDENGNDVIYMHPSQASAVYVRGLVHELQHIADRHAGWELPDNQELALTNWQQYRKQPAERRSQRAENSGRILVRKRKAGLADEKREDRLMGFFDEFSAATSPNPLNNREDIWNDAVGIEVSRHFGRVRINAMRSLKPGAGYATKALQFLKGLADKHEVELELSPVPFGSKRLNQRQLKQWYGRHGFEDEEKKRFVYRPQKQAGLSKNPALKPDSNYLEQSNGWALFPDQREGQYQEAPIDEMLKVAMGTDSEYLVEWVTEVLESTPESYRVCGLRFTSKPNVVGSHLANSWHPADYSATWDHEQNPGDVELNGVCCFTLEAGMNADPRAIKRALRNALHYGFRGEAAGFQYVSVVGGSGSNEGEGVDGMMYGLPEEGAACVEDPIVLGCRRLAPSSTERTALKTAKPESYLERTYYRGSTPGATERITTGSDVWDACLFVSDDAYLASAYGRHIDEYHFKPWAKIVAEGTAAFNRLGRLRKGENMLEFCTRIVKAAAEKGYDAVHFKMQGDIGTAVINRDSIEKTGVLEGEPKRREKEAAAKLAAEQVVYRSSKSPDAPLRLNQNGILYTSPDKRYTRYWGQYCQTLEVHPKSTLNLTRFNAHDDVLADDLAAFLEQRGVEVSEDLRAELESTESIGGEILQYFGQTSGKTLVECIKAAGYDSALINEWVADTGMKATSLLLFDLSGVRVVANEVHEEDDDEEDIHHVNAVVGKHR